MVVERDNDLFSRSTLSYSHRTVFIDVVYSSHKPGTCSCGASGVLVKLRVAAGMRCHRPRRAEPDSSAPSQTSTGLAISKQFITSTIPVVFAALNSLDDASCFLSLSMSSEGYDNLLRENGNPAARDLSSDRGKLSAFRKRTTDGYVDETLLTSNKISSTEFILLVVSLSRLGTG
jgi:hypothetical protein